MGFVRKRSPGLFLDTMAVEPPWVSNDRHPGISLSFFGCWMRDGGAWQYFFVFPDVKMDFNSVVISSSFQKCLRLTRINGEFIITLMNISAEQLRAAASIKDKITKLEQQLAKVLGGAGAALDGAAGKRRNLSAAARAKIAKAQKLRWAKYRAAKK